MPVLRPSLHVRLIPFRVVSPFEFRCFSVWHSRHDEGKSVEIKRGGSQPSGKGLDRTPFRPDR